MCRKRRWRGDERARTMVAARGRRRDACARRSMRRPHASVGVCGRASRSPKRRLRSVCAAVAARALECREPSADCAGGRRERSVPRGSMRFREKNRETDFSSRPDRPPAVLLKDTRHRSLTDRRDERARTTVAARGRRRDKKLASKLACARRSMRIDPITQVALITPGSPPSPRAARTARSARRWPPARTHPATRSARRSSRRRSSPAARCPRERESRRPS